MADLPFALEPALGDALSRALDVEGKIPRALDALGPIAGRDVLLVGGGPAPGINGVISAAPGHCPTDRQMP